MAAEPVVYTELVGWRNKKGQFAALTDENLKDQRTFLREYLGKLAKRAEELSPYQEESTSKTKYHGTHFRDQWRVNVKDTDTGSEGALTNQAQHANLVLYPTRRHIIEGKTAPKKLLRFVSDGTVFYRHQVTHPGTHGAANTIIGQIQAEFGEEASKTYLQRAARTASQRFVDYFSRYGS
jgi:hypothetical protein